MQEPSRSDVETRPLWEAAAQRRAFANLSLPEPIDLPAVSVS